MPFQECGEKVSHRWYRTWERWSQQEWNRPDRSDHFLMQISQSIQQFQAGFGKPPRQVTMEMQQIPFTFGETDEPVDTMTEDEKRAAATAASKARWASRGFGMRR